MGKDAQENERLSAIEMAALTSQVPCSGNNDLDKIIRLALRFRTAQAALEGLLARSTTLGSTTNMAKQAVDYADALIMEFSSRGEKSGK